MLEPVVTEKSSMLAKEGKYTFRVETGLTKYQIKALIEKVFKVHVIDVKSINRRKELSRNFRGKNKLSKAYKKAIVSLKKDEKIDLFEEGKKK